ncbi:hypothetical protein FGD67_21305 [Colwellia sp. M166]|uniref:hypothetical protein n=1 Tax=Colwellia sp. M166 TaxID=2583805 RepID=UPI00211DEF8B|nr:hypothetical protein [Colwellia sp. M166]UUO25470.1 hypothetical protein FGD67_21305 [Colwellia sp. M166]
MSSNINSIAKLLDIAELELSKPENVSEVYEDLRKKIIDKGIVCRSKGEYDNDFLLDLWRKRKSNGIANITSNNISEDEFKKIKRDLIKFTKKIARGNTQKVFDEIVDGFKLLKAQGKTRYVYRAAIARVFCTFYPDQHINWVTRDNIKDINILFSDSFTDITKVTYVSKDINWFSISFNLRQQINDINSNRIKPLESIIVRQITSLYYKRKLTYGKPPHNSKATRENNESGSIDNSSTKRKEVSLGEIISHNREIIGSTITVSQKEKELTHRFLNWINKRKGIELYGVEQRTGAHDRIDVTIKQGMSLIYAELKSVSSYSKKPKRAIRAALGQVLDYQFYDTSNQASELWIVLDQCKLTTKDKEFIKSLNSNFKSITLKLLVEKNELSFREYK